MKFIKSSFAQKLIIILIAIMIFNMAIPNPSKAWDVAGILFKPISTLIVSVLVSIDVTIGLTLTGISSAIKVLGSIVDMCTENERKCCGKC